MPSARYVARRSLALRRITNAIQAEDVTAVNNNMVNSVLFTTIDKQQMVKNVLSKRNTQLFRVVHNAGWIGNCSEVYNQVLSELAADPDSTPFMRYLVQGLAVQPQDAVMVAEVITAIMKNDAHLQHFDEIMHDLTYAIDEHVTKRSLAIMWVCAKTIRFAPYLDRIITHPGWLGDYQPDTFLCDMELATLFHVAKTSNDLPGLVTEVKKQSREIGTTFIQMILGIIDMRIAKSKEFIAFFCRIIKAGGLEAQDAEHARQKGFEYLGRLFTRALQQNY